MKHGLKLLAALLIGIVCTLPALADDIDIYNNPSANSLQPPSTIIVLDLNLLGICDNVLTNPGGSSVAYGSLNPFGPTACVNLRSTLSLLSFLSPTVSNPTQFLSNLLLGSGLGAAGLCNLYNLLGLASPSVPVIGALGIALGTLTCSTLSLLLNNPLTSGLVNALLGGFVNQLVAGLLNPLLSTLLGALPSAVIGLLDSALSAPQKILVDPLSLTNLFAVLGGILNNLINSKVAILVSHSNRSSNTQVQPADPYACTFADRASLPSTRQATTGCSNGGYFLVGFTALIDQSTISALLATVANQLNGLLNPVNLLTTVGGLSLLPGNLTPDFQEKENYDEIIHYLTGASVYNAPLKSYDGIFGLLSRDTSIESGSAPNAVYKQPPLACRTVNVLNVQLTNSTGESDSDSDLQTYFPGVALSVTGQPQQGIANLVGAAQTNGFQDKNGNVIKLNSFFLIQQNLSSLTALSNVGVNVLSYADSVGLLGLGQSVAQYLQPSLITNASLESATTTTSAGATTNGLLPPAFFSIFKPDANATTAQVAGTSKPAWYGNLKRLDLNQITAASSSAVGSYIYTDASCSDANAAAGNCSSAIASDGRIATTAKTYWTQTGQSKLGTASVDGREATLGGAGQNIPGYVYGGGGNPGRKNADNIRQLYYDNLPATNVPALAALDADPSVSAFAAERTALAPYLNCPTTPTTDTTCQALLLHARGFNVGTSSAPASNLSTVTGRSWMLGAVLHARPVAINYGGRSGYSKTDPDVRVLFGSADGFLHMLKNGPAASPSGQEVWAFMPRAVMGNLKTLRDDAYSSPNNLGFPYGVDGAPSVLIKNVNATTGVPANVYAYFGLRRGGGSYYALDLSNPDAPNLMWTLSKAGVYSSTYATPGLISGSTTQFTELAQTFSTPAIGKILLQGETNARSILIFGGGYNGSSNGTKLGKDLNNSRATGSTSQIGLDDSSGNALYIVDAMTGELLWKATKATGAPAYVASSKTFTHSLMQDSIPSDITALDTDGDGYTDRLYVGDTGGHVWRVDMPITSTGADRSKWTLSLLASLGRHASPASSNNTLANDRRFFEAPDFVPARDPGTNAVYDAVVIASGDREDPFNSTTLNDLYVLRDKDTVSGKTLNDTTTVDGVISSETDTRLLIRSGLTALPASCSGAASSCAVSNVTSGWRLALAGTGEKATSAPVTVAGNVVLSSFLPPSGAAVCTPTEGSGKLYALNLDDGRPGIASFAADSDGDSRSIATNAPGIPGEVNGVTTNTLGVNADTLTVQVVPYYRVYWRERRGDEEKPVPQ